MKEIKDKLLIEKYSDSISSYVHLDNVSLQMFEFEKGELMIQPSFHFHSIYFFSERKRKCLFNSSRW